MSLYFKPDAEGIPLLITATLNSDLETIEDLLDSGSAVNLKFGSFLETALHMACKVGDVATVELLLKRGADIHSLTMNKYSPFYIACYFSKEDVAKVLAGKGCDLNQQDITHRSPLMLAIERGLVSVVKLLVDHPACDVMQVDRRKRNALHYAVINRNVEAIRIFHEKGFLQELANMPDRLGVFPILMAARRGYLDVMVALLESDDVDPNVKDARFPNNCTALEESILNGNIHITKLLLKYGANIGIISEDIGRDQAGPILTSLMTNHERTDILQLLLEEGVDVNVQLGNLTYTPLRLAVDQGFFIMARMIVLADCNLWENKNWIEEYKQRGVNTPDMLAFFDWISGFLDDSHRPKRLSYWCRDVIRDKVGYTRPMCDQATKIPLPESLRKFLLFRDIQA